MEIAVAAALQQRQEEEGEDVGKEKNDEFDDIFEGD
jgi:hypothetical protein